jgi:hypothetical protein
MADRAGFGGGFGANAPAGNTSGAAGSRGRLYF